MKKRFVAKSSGKKKVWIKIVCFLVVIYFSLVVTFNLLMKTSINKILNKDSMGESLFNLATNETRIMSFDLLNPKSMLALSLNYVLEGEGKNDFDELGLMKKHENDKEPIVYIYNTHDTEEYDSSLLESYNIKYTVKIASYILSEKLRDLGIPTYVEEASMGEYLSSSGLLYKDSYDASRYYIDKRLKEYPSIKYIIDLHRDSVPRSATTGVIDGKNYAKVLFVVGLDHEGYGSNLSLAKRISGRIRSEINRDVMEKTGSKVNGIYNQDMSPNSLLIELGGLENTISEVDNTITLLAGVLRDEIKGEQ